MLSAVPAPEVPPEGEPEPEEGWRFSTFSAAAAAAAAMRFFRQIGLGYGDVSHWKRPSMGLSFSKSKFLEKNNINVLFHCLK